MAQAMAGGSRPIGRSNWGAVGTVSTFAATATAARHTFAPNPTHSLWCGITTYRNGRPALLPRPTRQRCAHETHAIHQLPGSCGPDAQHRRTNEACHHHRIGMPRIFSNDPPAEHTMMILSAARSCAAPNGCRIIRPSDRSCWILVSPCGRYRSQFWTRAEARQAAATRKPTHAFPVEQ